jgi:adenosylhomocysteine nucleosidase
VPEIAIIAALEREVRPLVNAPGWRRTGRVEAPYGCFESAGAVVVCAGIGREPARRAAEALFSTLQPKMVVSAGFAGALSSSLAVDDVFSPAMVVDTVSRTRFALHPMLGLFTPTAAQEQGRTAPAIGTAENIVLVSASGVATPEAKRLLAAQHEAQAVDMEAAVVAALAAAHRTPFMAIKAISDAYDFPMPDMQPYVSPEGKFQTWKFVLAVGCRPSLWGVVHRLRDNTEVAARQLCRMLQRVLSAPVEQIAVPQLATAGYRETTA